MVKWPADHVLDEGAGILDADGVDAECGGAHDAEFLVAHRGRTRRAPFQVGELARRAEIHLGLEGRFEAVFPALQRGEDGHVLRGERLCAGRIDVGELALVDERRHLPFAHHQLGAVFDLVVVALEAIHQRIVAVVEPFDDVDQFGGELFPQVHVALLSETY